MKKKKNLYSTISHEFLLNIFNLLNILERLNYKKLYCCNNIFIYKLYSRIHYSLFVDIIFIISNIFSISRAFYILHDVGIICIKPVLLLAPIYTVGFDRQILSIDMN